MTYRRLSTIAAAFLLLLTGACDNESSGDEQDAGADATQAQQRPQERAEEESDSSSEPSETAESEPSDDSENSDRPSATPDESGTTTEKPPLEIDRLLKPGDMADLDPDRDYTKRRLPGLEASPNYNSYRLRPNRGKGDSFGAGLQVWAFEDESQATQRINELKSQYLNVEPAPKEAKNLGSSAFLSTRNGFKTLVFQRLEPNIRVVAVSCSNGVCGESADLVQLADIVEKRLQKAED